MIQNYMPKFRNLSNISKTGLVVVPILAFIIFTSYYGYRKNSIYLGGSDTHYVELPAATKESSASSSAIWNSSVEDQMLQIRLYKIIGREDGLLLGNEPSSPSDIKVVFQDKNFALLNYPHSEGAIYALIDFESGKVKSYIDSSSYPLTKFRDVVYFINGAEGSISYYKPGMSDFQIVPGSQLGALPGESYSWSDGPVVQPKIERLGDHTISLAVFRKLKGSGERSEYTLNPEGAEVDRWSNITLP